MQIGNSFDKNTFAFLAHLVSGGWVGANENLNVTRNVSKVQTGCGCHVFVYIFRVKMLEIRKRFFDVSYRLCRQMKESPL
jgi:hypothetical protein